MTPFAQADAMLAAGQDVAAEGLLRQIVATDPRHADAHHRLGVIALMRGQPAMALTAFDAAIAIKPRAAIYHDSRGDALEALDQDEAAKAAWRLALRQDPKAVAPWVSLGSALARSDARDDKEEALKCFNRALALDPRAVAAHNGMGLALQGLNRHAEAEKSLLRAVQLGPDLAVAHTNLGNVQRDLLKLGEAEASLNRALQLDPYDPVGRVGMARVHMYAERFVEAEAIIRGVLADVPDSPTAHLMLAFLLLGTGRFAEAWEHYEWRNAAVGKQPEMPGANWDGTKLEGRTLLVLGDEGYGDFIHFARYVAKAAEQGRVVVQVALPLLRLVLLMPGVTQAVPRGAALPHYDVHCSATSLPRALRCGIEPVLADTPYFNADAADVAEWRTRLADLPGRRVGLVWQGNPDQRADAMRSIPFALLAPFATVPGVSFVSLQKDRKPQPGLLSIQDWTDELHDFADTAALIDGLDLVIAVDTAVAHLAGAMGKPVWLLNRWDGATDPRWLYSAETCPWYPTMRIFRQQQAGDWVRVIENVAQALREFAA